MSNTTGAGDERQRLTAVQGLAALSLDALSSVAYGPEAILEVIAVTVCCTDPEETAADVSFRARWEEWHPQVPLITLNSNRRSIARPIVKYLSQLEQEDSYHRLVVLIPEVQPPRFWDWVLFNQRGAILDRAIRRGTANVVLCRLRYRLEQFEQHPAASAASASAAPAASPPAE